MLTHLFGPVAELVADDSQILKKWVFPDGDVVIPETTDYANVILKFAVRADDATCRSAGACRCMMAG